MPVKKRPNPSKEIADIERRASARAGTSPLRKVETPATPPLDITQATWVCQEDSQEICYVCTKPILKGEFMMEFFRGLRRTLIWAHNSCVRSAMQTFIEKREARH